MFFWRKGAMSDVKSGANPGRVWMISLGMLVLVWLGLAFLLQPTFTSMSDIWSRSDTFAHGYVILPLSLWLMWRERHELAAIQAAPDWRVIFLAAPIALIWLSARVAGALVVEQYAFVVLGLLAVWALLGWRWFRGALFPLLYLLLMVPNGEFLFPVLIDYTADVTVAALQLAGIPVYREGSFFTLPSGEWSVVEECGGLRYLVSSITLGLLYAYLTYRTLWKRLAFTLAAVIVPLLANGLRAIMVVFTGHYSGMTLMIGEDHLWFGWVWFGVVMLIMFWVGLFWREDIDLPEKARPAMKVPRSPLVAGILLLLVIAAFPAWERWLAKQPGRSVALTAPAAEAGWQQEQSAFTPWLPQWQGADAKLVAYYRMKDQPVLLYVAHYGRQRQGSELISYGNRLREAGRGGWGVISDTILPGQTGAGEREVRVARLRDQDSGSRMLVWQWNRVAGRDLLNPYYIKFDLALSKLLGRPDDGAAILIATPYADKTATAEATLRAFRETYEGRIDAQLDSP
jgi:exosortase A